MKKHKNTEDDKLRKIIASSVITFDKFDDGTIRPHLENKGMYYYEILGMLELLKAELVKLSWDTAFKIRESSPK